MNRRSFVQAGVAAAALPVLPLRKLLPVPVVHGIQTAAVRGTTMVDIFVPVAPDESVWAHFIRHTISQEYTVWVSYDFLSDVPGMRNTGSCREVTANMLWDHAFRGPRMALLGIYVLAKNESPPAVCSPLRVNWSGMSTRALATGERLECA